MPTTKAWLSQYEVIIRVKRYEDIDNKLILQVNRIVVPLVKFSPTRYQTLLNKIQMENPFEPRPIEVYTTILDRRTYLELPFTTNYYNKLIQSDKVKEVECELDLI